MDKIDSIILEIKSERKRLRNEKSVIESECSDFSDSVYAWENDLRIYKETELQFIRSLNDEQLELYAKYEESKKNNNIAKSELHFRKLVKSISDKQKNEILNLLKSLEELDLRMVTIERKQDELTNKQNEILYAINKNEKKRERMLNYLAMRSSQQHITSGPSSDYVEVKNAIEKWNQNIQQRQQLRSINQSLVDIATAIRGY